MGTSDTHTPPVTSARAEWAAGARLGLDYGGRGRPVRGPRWTGSKVRCGGAGTEWGVEGRPWPWSWLSVRYTSPAWRQ